MGRLRELENRSTVYTKRLWNAESLKNDNITSTAIDLNNVVGNAAAFSLYCYTNAVADGATVKYEYLCSVDGVNYLEPSSASDITGGLAEDGGPGADGKDIFSFEPEPCRFLKIKATETENDETAAITVWICIH